MAIPSLRGRADLRLVERLVAVWPALSDARGWGARFGRELNRSDDCRLFSRTASGTPVVEGKHVDPFAVRVRDCEWRMPERAALLRPGIREAAARHRLAYRDVASASNRLTLIAAIVPPGAVTVHTLFCLRTALPPGDQVFLCCMLNSFVANYLVRLWVTTHLGTTTVERLPVPRPPDACAAAARIRLLGGELIRAGGRAAAAYAEVQALAAFLYGLTRADLELVFESLPLVEDGIKAQAAGHFLRLAERGGRV
jgi:hypothetical protein